MRHSKIKYQLNRFSSWRRATVLSLARSVFIHQSIKTTKIRARAVKPLIDKLITLAKENTLSAKRRAFRLLNNHRLVSMLFNDIGPRFKNTSGGYTRVMNLGSRRGDNADMAILELTRILKKEPKIPKKIRLAKEDTNKSASLPAGPGHAAIEPQETKKQETEAAVKEKPPISTKPTKKFLGGLRKIFKKERRDSL